MREQGMLSKAENCCQQSLSTPWRNCLPSAACFLLEPADTVHRLPAATPPCYCSCAPWSWLQPLLSATAPQGPCRLAALLLMPLLGPSDFHHCCFCTQPLLRILLSGPPNTALPCTHTRSPTTVAASCCFSQAGSPTMQRPGSVWSHLKIVLAPFLDLPSGFTCFSTVSWKCPPPQPRRQLLPPRAANGAGGEFPFNMKPGRAVRDSGCIPSWFQRIIRLVNLELREHVNFEWFLLTCIRTNTN